MPRNPATTKAIAHLIKYAEDHDLDESDLVEAVHEAKTDEATVINDEGLAAQVTFLVDSLGVKDAYELVRNSTILDANREDANLQTDAVEVND